MYEVLVAVLLAAGTLAGVRLGVWIQARKDARGAAIAINERGFWLPASLLALGVAFVGVVMWIGIAALDLWLNPDHRFIRDLAGEVRVTRGANGSVVTPWRVPRGSAGAALQVDLAPGGGRGRDGALRVTVDLPGPGETAAVQVPGEELPDGVDLATAWVYVEDSDAARSAGLHARLAGRMNAGSHGSFSPVGARTPLKPGAWTQVVWTGSYTLELSPALGGVPAIEKKVQASGQLTSLGVRLEADRPYRGSVFVDDLRVYTTDAPPPDHPR